MASPPLRVRNSILATGTQRQEGGKVELCSYGIRQDRAFVSISLHPISVVDIVVNLDLKGVER